MDKYTNGEIKDLFKKLGIEFLDNYKIDYLPLLDHKSTDSDYYQDNVDEFVYLTSTFGKDIRNRNCGDIYVSKTKDRGYGLFSLKDIPKGSFIGVYLGVIREEDDMVPFDENGFDTDYAWDYPDELPNAPLLEINAKYAGNELRFANHYFNPNIRVEHTVVDGLWYIFFLADRDIKADEEMTISYGDAYWESDYRELS